MRNDRDSRAIAQEHDLATDLEFVRSVLVRFPDPWDRYFLTLNLDATADALEELHDQSP